MGSPRASSHSPLMPSTRHNKHRRKFKKRENKSNLVRNSGIPVMAKVYRCDRRASPNPIGFVPNVSYIPVIIPDHRERIPSPELVIIPDRKEATILGTLKNTLDQENMRYRKAENLCFKLASVNRSITAVIKAFNNPCVRSEINDKDVLLAQLQIHAISDPDLQSFIQAKLERY